MNSSSTNFTLWSFRLFNANDLLQFAGGEQITRFLCWKTLTTTDKELTFIKETQGGYRLWRGSEALGTRDHDGGDEDGGEAGVDDLTVFSEIVTL
ncbi:hypothetical protein SSX86_011290 [Deinandra increscens subsp. villosa]|uniref:Uncharacterized protein n=1 Tax=Deinandra increscens subsp. villosa TaxID=3103831 RepID=A0AAP0H2I9_9ASTR